MSSWRYCCAPLFADNTEQKVGEGSSKFLRDSRGCNKNIYKTASGSTKNNIETLEIFGGLQKHSIIQAGYRNMFGDFFFKFGLVHIHG